MRHYFHRLVSVQLELDCSCSRCFNKLELAIVCAKGCPCVTFVRLEPTVQNICLADKVRGQSLDALIFAQPFGVNANYIAVKQLDCRRN